ncbi:MAG: hypothetical protein E6K81_03220 [Candidatus Eisenbacteria bacterium]|uniref:CobQ/CobB/MinD/ParA nucleotide binding domain-containing protein n=1 Tax=Eiseniibacteriota bacterium TaxID=2212470 RepID=A0A538UCV5_UNCEI|nr:MAG: hypothetical protein E6K81_03220 [Candidatus Eisenbacteria bacterium]
MSEIVLTSRTAGRPVAAAPPSSPARPAPAPPERLSPAARDQAGFEGAFENALASAVRGLVGRGMRTLLITSSAAGEGKSTLTAHLGRALARSGRESVVLVDADPYRPTLRRIFGLRGDRGLGELIEETYLADLAHLQGLSVGVGDWMEVLRGQQRTGDLALREGDVVCVARFVKGSLACLMVGGSQDGDRLGDRLVRAGRIDREQRDAALRLQETTGRMLGDLLHALGWVAAEHIAGVVREQAADRVRVLVALAQPECRFQELAEAHLPASGGRTPCEPIDAGIDALLDGRIGRFLRDPLLSNQVASCLSDTATRNLKVLPQGSRPCDFMHAPFLSSFPLLMARLARSHDIVLVDAPPVSLTTPTVALAARVDGVVMVVKAVRSRRPAVRRAVEELRRGGANVLGAVLNQVDVAGDAMLTPYYRAAAAER